MNRGAGIGDRLVSDHYPNWATSSGQQWTVPLGDQVSQIIPIAKIPVNFLLGAYYNIVKPDNGPEWSLRFQIALMFPE